MKFMAVLQGAAHAAQEHGGGAENGPDLGMLMPTARN